MRSAHQNTAWLLALSGGLTLGFADFAMAQETQPQETPAVEQIAANKDPLFPYTISKETTRFTEPVKADGTLDFAAALNARNSQGLKPEDNAAVLLMQAFGSASVPEANREAFYRALGIAVPKSEKGVMQDLGQIIGQHLEAKGQSRDETEAYQPFRDQQGQAMSRPWSRKEFPLVAQWVDANSQARKLALEASRKSRLYLPLVVGEQESLITANLEGVQEMRNVARLLTTSAMLALEEGRIEEAQTDLLACHRLASLLGQHATMIQAMVCCALDSLACRADLALAQSEKVTPEQLAAYRQKLAELPALPNIGQAIDKDERFLALDAISRMATNIDEESAQVIGFPKAIRRLLRLNIDWDLILKQFNAQYDQMAASLKRPSHAERQKAIGEMEDNLKKLRTDASHPAIIAMMAFAPRASVSQHISNTLLLLLTPAVSQASYAEIRADIRRDQTIIAFALAEHHREQGSYPETLEALSPQYLKTVPQDRFTDKPLKYQRHDNGYLLYSLGPNGQDDNGQNQNADIKADDWSIRVPSEPEL